MPHDRVPTATGPSRALRAAALVLLAALALPAAARAGDAGGAGAKAADPHLIGVFAVGPDAVVDGDTLRLQDGGPTVRVLALDTEELFHEEADRAAAEADFDAYARAKRGDHPRPRKYGTPAGEAAKAFVAALLEGVASVRLERDDLNARPLGTYGRRLAHVILLEGESEINLAAAVIRAGHSPYFSKYGRSIRYHELYARAEQEALAARRGIWGSTGPRHYPDYPERCRWWRQRAMQVERWRAAAGKADHVTLGALDADEKLAALLGKQAVVFGLFDRELPVKSGDRRILLLGHMPRRGLPLVFFDTSVAAALDMAAIESRFVTVTGKITEYRGRPQIVVEKASQVSTR